MSSVPPVKYHFVLTVNQTARTLGTQKTELVYASISLCWDIIKIHMLFIGLVLCFMFKMFCLALELQVVLKSVKSFQLDDFYIVIFEKWFYRLLPF